MNIIYEDEDVLVLDKPAGVSVHPGAGSKTEPTIIDFVKGKVADPDPERPGIVHRLDKDTSGVLIVAKNPEVKAFLQSQFKNREVTKTYVALVHGKLERPQAILEWPIGRHNKNPLKRAVVGGGKPATTQYKVVKEFSGFSLLEISPKTGRTHQIRVHLARLGHPIVGDELYGKPDAKLARQFLHAQRLELQLPNGKVKKFMSPLPAELQAYLGELETL